jgi:spermidine/putrescine-binding protein
MALVALAGCGSDEPSSSSGGADQGFTPPEVPMLQSLGAGEGKLNLVAWAGYAEDGSTDPTVDWVTPFEKETGCQTNVKVAATSDEMVQLMKSGQYDSVSASGDAALYLKATKPELGIDNPYELDDKQFQASVDLLKQQATVVGEYWSDYAKAVQAFKSGSTVLGTSWQIIANLAEADKAPVKAILPKEGSTGWSDTWMVSSKAANPNCAYRWMDYVISPKVNAQVAEWFGEAPANRKACQETADKQHCATFHADDEAYFARVAWWTTPIKQCGDDRGAVCKDYSEWTTAWTEIKG